MILPFSSELNTESDTKKVALEFSKLLQAGDVVALTGNLGSGKTFFVKSVCEEYEIANASSPSFAIVNSYKGIMNVNHFDFYRIENVVELYDIGFDEYLNDDSITFIEWAEMFGEILPKLFYKIVIDVILDAKRIITITKNE